MIALAFDTVSSSFSISVTNKGIIHEVNLENIKNHNIELLPQLEIFLADKDFTIDDMDFIAIGTGPGSFTALRIAFSTVKAICYAKNIPVIGISSLKSLYKNIETDIDLKIAMIGARKNSVFTSIYSNDECIVDEKDMTVESVLDIIKNYSTQNTISITGDGYTKNKEVIDNFISDNDYEIKYNDNIIHAKNTLSLATERYNNNDLDDLFTLKPSYLRKSEAEIKKEN